MMKNTLLDITFISNYTNILRQAISNNGCVTAKDQKKNTMTLSILSMEYAMTTVYIH